MYNKCKTPIVAKFWLRIVFLLIVFLHLFSLLFNRFFVIFKIICFFDPPKQWHRGVGCPHFVEPNLTLGPRDLYRMRNLPQM
jgi:hypothetical protein